MVSVVGGSGVFSGPTGAQYQQAGVEGLSGALAQQRAFQEQKRQALDNEIWRMAEDYGKTLGIPAVAAFQDPGFKGMAQQKLGSSMGGFLGLGGARRTEAYLNELSRIYSGQEADRLAAEGNLARGRLQLQTGEQVDRSFDQAGYNAAYANLVAPPPPPAAVTPPPAPGTQPPASTPAPASTVPPVSSAGHLGERVAVGGGTPTQSPRVEAYQMAADQAAAAGQPALPGPKAAAATPGVRQTPLGFQAIGPDGQALKDGKGIPLNYKTQAEAQAASQNAFAPKLVTPTLTPGLAESKPAPEAAGQSAGVGAAKKWENTDPTRAQTDQLKAFWDYALAQKQAGNPDFAEFRGTNPAAGQSIDSLKNAATGYRNTFSRWASGDTGASQGTTPASTASAAPVGVELPTKLGWSSDDLALFRRFQSVSPDEIGSDPQTRQEYARFRQMNQQLKDEFTKETRKEIRGYAAAPGYEKDQLVRQSLQFLETTDPSNPILKDPRFANLSTNLTQQNIRMAEAKIRNELAQAGYTEAKIKTVVDDTEAALLMGQAEVLKARNEGLKAAYEGIDTVISDLTAEFSKAMFAAKGNKAQEDSALAAYNKALSENPVLQSMWDSSLKLMAQSNGLQVTMENYMIQRAKFLQAKKETKIPTASAFETGTEEPQYSAEEQAVLNSY